MRATCRRGWMLVLLAPAVAASPQTAAKPGAIEGSVSDSLTGMPVRKALVTLRSETAGERFAYRALTAANGAFRIDNVSPGRYAIWAEAEGYVRNEPDADRPAAKSQSVALAEDQIVKGVLPTRVSPTLYLKSIRLRAQDVSDDGQIEVTPESDRWRSCSAATAGS
jgi:Carboxypeptidase regulatory-like domain